MSSASASQTAGRRLLANTVIRVLGELIGKLLAFAVFAVFTREVKQSAVGSYVVAFAYVQISMMVVDLGFDRVVIRQVASSIDSMPKVLSQVVALKSVLILPVIAGGWAIASTVGYTGETHTAIEILTAGQFFDALSRSIYSVMNARERGGLLTSMGFVERAAEAGLGITVLMLGFGMLALCVTYTIGSIVGFLVGLFMIARYVGTLELHIDPRQWRSLLFESLPFAVYDSLSFVFTKADTIILSLLKTHSAVALYGGASRLYEASFFITYSINGTFAAMFTSLSHTTVPTIASVFERSIKLVVGLLMPITVTWMVEARPLAVLLFGMRFAHAAGPLRLLAPSVVLMGVANLSASLVALRAGARALLPLTAGSLMLNILLNLAIVPRLGARGSGLAMSLALVAFAAAGLFLASRLAGPFSLLRMLGSSLGAGASMAIVMLAIELPLAASIALGVVVFIPAFAALEWMIAPEDLRFMIAILRRPLGVSGPRDV
jgi:O-antigen/teichoic acid export membrane protein